MDDIFGFFFIIIIYYYWPPCRALLSIWHLQKTFTVGNCPDKKNEKKKKECLKLFFDLFFIFS